MGGGGCIQARPEFLAMLREETTKAGSLLILDEVMTSRLAPGGLSGKLGIKGDLTTYGKYIGGGMSFGAFGGKAEIMDRYDPRRPDVLPHAGTFNNNVLTMNAGLAGLTEVYTPEAATALNARGDRLRGDLNALIAKSGLPIQVAGQGSMLAIHFNRRQLNDERDALKGDARLKELCYFHMIENGIYMAKRGFMALSVALGEPEYERLTPAFGAFLKRYAREIEMGADR